MLTMIFSSVAVLSISATELDTIDVEFDEDTPFIRYEDEEGIHYVGAAGDTTLENTDDDTAPAADAADEDVRDKGELVAVGNNVLPSSVDLSATKYFPAVGSQGSLGSCATWGTVYYQFTYEINRMRGTAATAENTASPKFVYNLLSDMKGTGTSAEENYAVLKTQGAPPISMLPYDNNGMNWCVDEKIWREALNWRLESYEELQYLGRDGREITSEKDPDLDEIKSALNNGHVVAYSSYINSWVSDKIEAHPDAPENSKHEGEEIVKYLNGSKGGHRMVIVGYNDDIWFDQNGNNQVDEGEKGAFKIANSWGSDFGNSGFCWFAYDAVNYKTSVEGGYDKDARYGGMNSFFVISVKPYKQGAGIYLKFTLNTADRTQFIVRVNSEHNGTEEKGLFLDGVSYTSADNKYSFSGKTGVAEDGTFCFPLDNVSPGLTAENFDEYNFTVTIKDTTADSKPLVVKNLELVNEYTGKSYKPAESLPTLDGSEKVFNIKACDTDNKVIYYIGYDEPTLHYRENGVWKEAEMEYNEEHIGSNYKYVIKELPGDVPVYFTDKNGNVDDNSGSYYVAKDRLNYFRTTGVREPLKLNNFYVDPEEIDVNINRYMVSEVSGGYEPYAYQYTIEHISSGKVAVEKFRYSDNIFHYFSAAGDYKILAEVRDQSGDIATFERTVTVTDIPFTFSEFTATNEKGGILMAGEDVTFYARTDYEKIAYMRTYYDIVIKDSSGKVCHEASVKPSDGSTNFGYSIIYYNWTPAKKGDYTITISDTDNSGEYAERTISFTVGDKIYGDANGDGEVNVKDATALQKSLAGVEYEGAFRRDLADCDVNDVISVKDATCIRKFLANMANSAEAGKVIEPDVSETEPDNTVATEPVTEPKPVGKNTVTFTNSFNWSGTISCYYWSDSNKNMTAWPGKAMKNAGTNTFGETLYTFDVPEGATYIIFTNGSSQTVDIPYSGGEVKFYPLSETDSQGHNKVANW